MAEGEELAFRRDNPLAVGAAVRQHGDHVGDSLSIRFADDPCYTAHQISTAPDFGELRDSRATHRDRSTPGFVTATLTKAPPGPKQTTRLREFQAGRKRRGSITGVLRHLHGGRSYAILSPRAP